MIAAVWHTPCALYPQVFNLKFAGFPMSIDIKNELGSSAASTDWHAYNWITEPKKPVLWDQMQRLIALFALILLSPVFGLLSVAVKTTSPGPFMYKQSRPGRLGASFTAYKIRTMRTGADKDASRARRVDKSDPMITPIGRILRDLKLDELPQLVNVLKGEMVLVGPRPIAQSLQDELEKEIPGFARRLNVKPGLSSLAQVCIFDNADQEKVVEDWHARFEAELDYLHKKSFRYDMLIICMTALFLIKKVARKVSKKLILLALGSSVFVLTACAERVATRDFVKADAAYQKDIRAYGSRLEPSTIDIQPVSIDPEQDEAPEPDYRLGSGDRLLINVFGEPGLEKLVAQVDGFGNIQLPYLEHVAVSGKTVSEIQTVLKTGFSKQFLNPWVVVQVADYKSRPVYLLGKFNNPGVVYLNGPTNLLQVMTMGQGLSEEAHLRGARLWRGEQIAPVDLQALLISGRPEHNVYVKPGDTIYIPSKTDRKAYVLGAVVRAGAVPFANEPMTLMKALTQVGGPVKSAALLSQVRVIRVRSAVEGELILVNAKDILKGKAPDLELMPEDIVYVPDNMLESWNQVVRAVTPTLQLAGGALQPFVQAKFLKGD
jgi:polysaccharide export outer membrane protein